MEEYRVVLLKGDGIGPEIVDAAAGVLRVAAELYGFSIHFTEELIGGAAIEAVGQPLPDQTVRQCGASDAVLLGAVGGPQWDGLPGELRPETGLLGIRKALQLYANLRPARVLEPLRESSPLKKEAMGEGIDLLVVRELTGGIYFGQRGRSEEGGVLSAFDTERYSVPEIERIARIAFELAAARSGRLTSVDKANVLESSRLWREVVQRVHQEYPQVQLQHMYVDNAAMQLVVQPGQFDVILTSNLFGDILSDEAAVITGSIGMLPSASLSDRRTAAGRFGLYEPVHGSAPDIAGTGKANPLAAILSAAMMLRYSLGEEDAAEVVERAAERALRTARTCDVACGCLATVSTARMGQLVEKIMKETT